MTSPLLLSFSIGAALLAALWLVVQFKTGRPDGRVLTGDQVHPYRRMLPIIMRTKAESTVYFDHWIDATQLLPYMERARREFDANITHILVAAAARALHHHPHLNRFVASQRLYQRDGVWISFSMKRKKLDAGAKVSTIKKCVPAEWGLRTLSAEINAEIDYQRSDEETYLDREVSFFLKLPHMLLTRAARLMFWANDHNLLPGSFIEDDGMFASAYMANLGSLGMEAGYHHLYEWGNCPLFIVVGAISERPVPSGERGEGGVTTRPMMHIRFTYDERINDGLNAGEALADLSRALEDPVGAFGADGETPFDPSP